MFFWGCSKGVEPSPTESQSVMLTVTPQATLIKYSYLDSNQGSSVINRPF